MSRQQNAEQNHSIMTTNKLFEIIANFKCLGTTITNQNCINEEIKSN